MTSKFNVGDKVKLLNGGYEYPLHGFMNGEVYDVAGETTDAFGRDKRKRIKLKNKTKYGYALPSDLELAESKPTKNQRISLLEETVTLHEQKIDDLRKDYRWEIEQRQKEINELKLIVAQIRKPSTEVSEALSVITVEDIIEFEGKQYKKVDREAREGDVVIFKDGADSLHNIDMKKTYKVVENLAEMACIQLSGYGLVSVYNNAWNRTPETVDVYELIVEDIPFPPFVIPEPVKTANQLRAEMIEKAKEFIAGYTVEKNEARTNYYMLVGSSKCYVEFVVDDKKFTVVALIRNLGTDYVIRRGIAKCMPSDVFNEHIGKAIALGRALGLDVSEFEGAVQPTDFIKGQLVKYANSELLEVDHVRKNEVSEKAVYFAGGTWMRAYVLTIINDTNAIYGGGE